MPDDLTHELGDPAEARLAAAFTLRATGACPASATVAKGSAAMRKTEAERVPYLVRSPVRENRLLGQPPS